MKMNRFILPLVAMALLATGCTKEYVSYNYGAQVETIRVNVNPGDWQFNEGARLPGGQNYFYCTVDIPAITDEVFDFGTVQAYVWNIYNVDQNPLSIRSKSLSRMMTVAKASSSYPRTFVSNGRKAK